VTRQQITLFLVQITANHRKLPQFGAIPLQITATPVQLIAIPVQMSAILVHF
jgi:hypothetical protein